MLENDEQADGTQSAQVHSDQKALRQAIMIAASYCAHDCNQRKSQADKDKDETDGRHGVPLTRDTKLHKSTI